MVRFFQRGWPMVLFFFLLGNIGQVNVFYDILEQEKGFSTLKKKSENWDFSKGVDVWFCSKFGL